MITLVRNELLGCVERQPSEPRELDRSAAILYGQPRWERRSAELGALTRMEQWALDHDRCIGMSLQDSSESLSLPPDQRPNLVRLVALATFDLPGGVLVEGLKDLGDDLTRAVVGHWLVEKLHKQVWYRQQQARSVSHEQIQRWQLLAGRAAVEDAHGAFQLAVSRFLEDAFHEDNDPGAIWTYLGSGPLRGIDLARSEDLRLRGDGWSDRAIRNYLGLYGYINPAGTVGRWRHENLKALRARS